jgi:hypothetical protein
MERNARNKEKKEVEELIWLNKKEKAKNKGILWHKISSETIRNEL